MRKLLVRLVALETALVGWLGYWLFLIYSNNEAIGQNLVSQLGRFPQLSFTTVDIAVLTIVSGISIFFAFKFQRGLKPGIRLERALQMLEGMMKRNLVLEAQVSELRMEKANVGVPPASMSLASMPGPGSWERAFRTPIEAGQTTVTSQGVAANQSSSEAARSEPGQNRPPPAQPYRQAQQSRPFPVPQQRITPPSKPQKPGSNTTNSDQPDKWTGEPPVSDTSSMVSALKRKPDDNDPPRGTESLDRAPGFAHSPRRPSRDEPYIPFPVPKETVKSVAVEHEVSKSQSLSEQPGALKDRGMAPQSSSPSSPSEAAGQALERNLPRTLLPVGYASPRSSSSSTREGLDHGATERASWKRGKNESQSEEAHRQSLAEKGEKPEAGNKNVKGNEKTLKKFPFED